MTDRLTLTRALEGSGMQSVAAERIATEIYNAIHDNVATKTDLHELEQRLNLTIAKLKTKLTIRAAVIALAGLSALFGALHLWPPYAALSPAAPRPAAPRSAMQLAGDVQPPPYSCRLLYDEQKKCAFGACEYRALDRLKNQCLRDGGRP